MPMPPLPTSVPLSWYLTLSAILFALGVAGFLFRGGGPTPGGFPVVSSSSGKVETSVPGALRPKRSLN